MDPTLEEKQNEVPQQKQSKEGAIGQGISAINNLARARRGFSNPLGKIGQRVAAQTALRGLAALLAGPGLPVLIAIITVFIFTFIIVGFGGAPPPPETSPQTPSPILPAQETITTPAAP